MNGKSALIVLAILLIFLTVHAQETSPLVRGTVDISIKKGTIACDLIVTNLPQIANYVIRLNSGMNVRYFRDLSQNNHKALDYDMDTKDSIMSDETKAYLVHENHNRERYLPKELEVKYLGMYNVVPDSASGYMGSDWRGNIAFNGYSVRAEGLQSAWYPILYDKDTRKLFNQVRYNIQITCNDCSVLFINGSNPVKAQKANFVSDVPREMDMYCGAFKTAEDNGVWLLNSDMKKEDEQKLFNTANTYQHYYEKKFGIPFKGSLTFVQTDPVADPKEWAFAFFSAPTTFNVGSGKYGLQSLFNGNNSAKSKQSMAHELAHYYFGTLIKPGDEFGHAIEEGMAEYLSYKLTLDLEGSTTYHKLLKNKIESLKYLNNYKPFAQVKTENDYGNREYYKYYYAPVLFMAIEKEIGEQTMWNWLKAMTNTQTDHANYQFLLSTLDKVVTDKSLKQKIVDKYFTSDKALQNAKDELGEK